MPEIKLLDQATINLIAAGEVIERPASVVKELFENAVDARATAVTVEIRDGGTSLIRVTDNGCGIEKDQVRIAFERHATSKIQSAMDLVTVSTMGFRGEALSSIAAVSEVELITKTPQALYGTSYRISDGKEISLEEIGAPDGTTFLVRNLFGHIPARRNFLKSAQTEGAHIAQLMENMALSRPDIHVRFLSNGQNKLSSTGNGRLRDLIYQIYGRDISSQLEEIEGECRYFRVEGYLGKPIISRGNRSFENYFINGRFVRSSLIGKAIENAYKPYMMQHRYPFTVLHITIDPELIDVNVHPAKLELRFRYEEEIYSELSEMIRKALSKAQLVRDVELTKKEEPVKSSAKGPEPFESRRREDTLRQDPPACTGTAPANGATPSPAADPPLAVREEGHYGTAPASGATLPPAADPPRTVWEEGHYGTALSSGIHRRIGQNEGSSGSGRSEEPSCPAPYGESSGSGRDREDPALEASDKTSPAGSEPEQTFLPGKEQAAGEERPMASPGGYEQLSLEEKTWTPPFLSAKARKEHRILGQIFDTYWLVEYQNKLYIMDQHAAHEKVLYEKLAAAYEGKERLSQMLDPPLELTLSPVEENVLASCREDLERIGYEISSTGDRIYRISAVPANLYGIPEKDLFLDFLGSLEESGNADDSRMLDHRLATMACKAAVKGGMKISIQEADHLISQLLTLKNPYACPHGRPTLISISRYELEKRFKRVL